MKGPRPRRTNIRCSLSSEVLTQIFLFEYIYPGVAIETKEVKGTRAGWIGEGATERRLAGTL